MEWGTISVGTQKNITLQIQSISNRKTTLFLSATNWNPPNISNYMNLSWNYSGALINPGEIVPITLTLSTSSLDALIRYLIINNVKEFIFDIAIEAIEYTD